MVVEEYYQNASDVRKNWSMTIDSVVHERPVFVNRTHDRVTIMDMNVLSELLANYNYHVVLDKEDDGSVTGFVEELDLVENAPSKDECLSKIVLGMKDYASDFYSDFNYWSKAPNREHHVPYILKLLISDTEEIMEDIVCRDGKN